MGDGLVTFYPADKGLESMIKSELHTVSNQGSPCVVVNHSGVVPNVETLTGTSKPTADKNYHPFLHFVTQILLKREVPR